MSSGLAYGLGKAMAVGPRYLGDNDCGPVTVVLFLVALATAGSVAFARYFIGPQAFQRTGYDLEAYVLRKFPVCLGSGLHKPAAPPVEKTCHPEPYGAAEEVEASSGPLAEEEEEEGVPDP